MDASGPMTVRELLGLLRHRQVRLLAGSDGLGRAVTWASTMRARLPAFAGFQGGEVALLSLATLRTLRGQLVSYSLPFVVDELAEIGASAIIVSGAAGDAPGDAEEIEAARTRAEREHIPLLTLPVGIPLGDVEQEIVAHVVARRERQAAGQGARGLAAAADMQVMLREEALDALLTGTYAGEAQMRARAAQLGYDLSQPHAALWVSRALLDESHAGGAAPARAADALRATYGAWVRVREHDVIALLPLAADDRGIGEMAARIAQTLTAELGNGTSNGANNAQVWSAGLGEPARSPAEVRRSAVEAHDAARLGLEVLGPGHVARQADLGVYKLLLALNKSNELEPFVSRVLAPLQADARNGDALIETLEAFFASNGNLSEAARRLHLHRNSLIYRLNRAHELLGRDLDDPELRLSLQLAIKGRRVLGL